MTQEQFERLVTLMHMAIFNVIDDQEVRDLLKVGIDICLVGCYNINLKEDDPCTDDDDTTPVA